MRGNIAIQNLALILGAHIRVGNEDNLWDNGKKRWESVNQVEWAVKIADQFGRKIATADEARKMMKIGTWYHSVDETLSNLGLPPNRGEGQKGFLVHDTDGRLSNGDAAKSNSTSIL
ncbi:MAG: 3-keto-5-aminohexanoate cleavage protein [Candidatus Binatia bacterium]